MCLLQDSKIVHPVAMRLSPDSQPFMSDSMTASAYSGLTFSYLIFTLCCLHMVKFAAHTASFVLSVFSQYRLSCKGRIISLTGFGAGVTNFSEPRRVLATSTIAWVRI